MSFYHNGFTKSTIEDAMKISDFTVEVVSELYNAGITEDGEFYSAETFFVVITAPNGKRLAHFKHFLGCNVHEHEGIAFFEDIRESAKSQAEILKNKIEAHGEVDPQYWHEIQPEYGSEYYAANY